MAATSYSYKSGLCLSSTWQCAPEHTDRNYVELARDAQGALILGIGNASLWQ